MSRPKLPQRRTRDIRVVITEDEKLEFVRAAGAASMPVSSWVRMQLLVLLRKEAKASQRELEAA
jgi:hypothetical protein